MGLNLYCSQMADFYYPKQINLVHKTYNYKVTLSFILFVLLRQQVYQLLIKLFKSRIDFYVMLMIVKLKQGDKPGFVILMLR